jgi:hypothetical protein
MNTALNQAGWLPTTPPFEDSIRLIPTDSVTADLFATHPQIVDWIRVSLRRDRAAVTTVATRAGFLTDSGLVVDMDGTSPLTFPGIPPGSYYIVIEHVNHLGVMTTERIALGPRSELLDLTNDPARIYQGVIKDLGNGFYGLYGGDATGDGCLYYVGPNRDVLPILDLLGIENANGSVEGYFPADMNLDGLVAHTGPNSDQSVLIDALGPDNLSGIICTAVPAFINKAGASIRLIDAPNMNLRF